MLDLALVNQIVAASLAEDIGTGDISAALLPSNRLAEAFVISRESAVICGISWVTAVFQQVDPNIKLEWHVQDGETVTDNQTLLMMTGPARSILSGERCALNWLQTLSGTATVTAAYVAELAGLSVKLLDTRKTIPGLRYAQKYAVRCGGGHNHRMGLYDAFLIKENHIMSAGSIAAAISQARIQEPAKIIEIEVENLQELKQALDAKADIILLDNFEFQDIEKAVHMNQNQAQLEVSGNVTQSNIRQIAMTGIDRISVGALTKHVRAIDLSLRIKFIKKNASINNDFSD